MNANKAVSVAFRPFLRLLPQPAVLDKATPQRSAGRTETPVPETAQAVRVQSLILAPKGVTFVPTEAALLLNVTLPKMAASQRRAAVQFAIEDQIAQPLDMVHVVLGPKVQDDGSSAQWLVAVISNAAMDGHVKSRPADADAMLLDVLALQVPAKGAWSVLEADGRVLVRLPDWSGFATTPAMLPLFWKAGGSPKIVLLGGVLPGDVPVEAVSALDLTLDPGVLSFDLRSASFGRPGAGWPKGARAMAGVLAVAVGGHLGLLGLDVVGLQRIVSARETAISQALTAAGQIATGDIEGTLTTVLAAQSQPAVSDFLPLLAQSFGAISAQSGQVQIRDLRYAEAQNALTLTIEASDLAALQTVETAFAAANLQVTAGAATTKDGAAEAQMTLGRAVP